MKLSVHIVTRGRPALLKRCVLSVAEALPADAEACVVVNGEDPAALEWLSSLDLPGVRYHVQPFAPLSDTRNRALLVCQGEILHCLDDDVTVPRDLFHRVLERFDADLDLAIVGGPNLTPPGSSWPERLFGAILTSPFAAPRVRTRYGAERRERAAAEYDLMFCNFAFRRDAVRAMGETLAPFGSAMVSNEETLFARRCLEAGLKAIYCPSAWVYHARRSTLLSFARQVMKYGAGRARQDAMEPRARTLWMHVPALAVGVGLALAISDASTLALLGVAHALLSLLGALSSSDIRALGWRGILAAIPLTGLVHSSYGIGLWRGWLQPRDVRPPEVEPLESLKAPQVGLPSPAVGT